jgi:integrase
VESFKTGKSLGDQRLEIPNPLFSNGKCFYEYLEAFIYGCYCDKKGNWISASKVLEPLLGSQYYELRAALEPNHTHLFTRPFAHNPFGRSQFSATIRDTSHRLTGKHLTPHLLRDIYATYFLDQGHTEDRIRSLAYAMGHSVEMLRKVYDRRRPQQKNRPIEEAMVEVVNQYMT